MKRQERYSLLDLKKSFPDDKTALEYVFDAQHSRTCSCGGRYSLKQGRKQFQCSKCRFQIAPTANTIFHKSDTPLTLWFWAIFIFSSAKSGVSAKELERQLGVTYKTAWRILMLIRKALPQGSDLLTGEVEIDEGFIGGKGNKEVVMGAVERGGKLKAKVLKGSRPYGIEKFIREAIRKQGTTLLSDSDALYPTISRGYERETVNHSKKEFVKGRAHTNTIDSFWAHVKRSINGTHKVVSRKHLQAYLDGFVFHYDNRYSDRQRFEALLGTLLRPSR